MQKKIAKMCAICLCFLALVAMIVPGGRFAFGMFADPSTGGDTTETVVMLIGSPTGVADGEAVDIDGDPDVVPFVEKGTVFVPLGFTAQALDWSVKWNKFTRAMTLSKNGIKVTFTVGRDRADRTRSGSIRLGAAVQVVHEKIYVSLKGMADALGYEYLCDRGLIAIGKDIESIRDNTDVIDALIVKCNGLPTFGTEERFFAYLESLGIGQGSKYNLFDAGIMVAPSMVDEGMVSKNESTVAANDADLSRDNADFSSTNTQVAGVDEGDIIKTDGKYIYYLNNNRVYVVKAYPAKEMALECTLTFDDAFFSPREVYVDGDTAIVVGHTTRSLGKEQPVGYYYWWPTNREMTRAYIYDITDRNDIKLVRTVDAEGSYLASRKIGPDFYFVTNQYLWSLRCDGGYQLPEYRDTAVSEVYCEIDYGSVYYFPGVTNQNYLTVTGFTLDGMDRPSCVETYFGAGDSVYVSTGSLYIAATQYNYYPMPVVDRISGPTTNIFKFNLGGGEVLYAGQGSVPGNILNQFSMDEHKGNFRIATTSYNYYDYRQSNNLFILDGKLDIIGSIKDIAPEERIYSVRFMGDKGYMVTFRNVDPLFAFDLTDPTNPVILGALKIPGYSNYLHPYDENHLIGFGKDTVEQYGTAYYQGMKMSMFDVTDMTNPIELFTEVIGDRGTESELLYNHRALLFSREKNIIAFPVTLFEIQKSQQNRDATTYGQFTFQGALVYGVDMEKGFVKMGQVTHLTDADKLKAGLWGGDADKYVRRMVYIGDNLYSASNKRIQANSLKDFKVMGGISFE